jgi:hypothetical protein
MDITDTKVVHTSVADPVDADQPDNTYNDQQQNIFNPSASAAQWN